MIKQSETVYRVIVFNRVTKKATKTRELMTEAEAMKMIADCPSKFIGCHVTGFKNLTGSNSEDDIKHFRIGMIDEVK